MRYTSRVPFVAVSLFVIIHKGLGPLKKSWKVQASSDNGHGTQIVAGEAVWHADCEPNFPGQMYHRNYTKRISTSLVLIASL
ncbi:hypothetical protein DFS33DRAFT_1347507 [Desarmillaria ectypa]|nr:hypothetical protein DFS33DRAFT_1347507 [Desarmillaria ectypa]